MAHVREQIRNNVATALGALAGGRVYTSRVYPIDVLPAIGVFANSESSTEDPTLGIPRLNRQVDLTVEIAAEAVADVDDVVDALAADVEAAIAANPTLSGVAVETPLIATTITLDGGDAELPLAFARLTFRVWYRTTTADPETAI